MLAISNTNDNKRLLNVPYINTMPQVFPQEFKLEDWLVTTPPASHVDLDWSMPLALSHDPVPDYMPDIESSVLFAPCTSPATGLQVLHPVPHAFTNQGMSVTTPCGRDVALASLAATLRQILPPPPAFPPTQHHKRKHEGQEREVRLPKKLATRYPITIDAEPLRATLVCPGCQHQFHRFDNLRRHMYVAETKYGGVCNNKRGRRPRSGEMANAY